MILSKSSGIILHTQIHTKTSSFGAIKLVYDGNK